MPKKSKSTVKYENNPFFIASNGITLLYESAQGVGILLLVLALVNLFGNNPKPDDVKTIWNDAAHTIAPWTMSDWLLAAAAGSILLLAFLMISALFGGVSAYTSYKLSKEESVKFVEAFHVAFDNLWGFLWLQIIIFVKVLLWSLLLIIPGIIMSFRYSLANTAYFDEKKDLRGDAAIQESLRLTKGAWLTTFSANMLFNILSFGIISSVISLGVNAVLYRQFDAIGDKKKPDAHWLAWLTLGLPFILICLALTFIIVIGIVTAIFGTLFR